MKEFLVCDMCTATVSTDMSVCDFCGNDFKNSGTSAEIIRLKDEIEKKIYTSNLSELLGRINKSKFKDHPVILFRRAKALLIDYMTNDGILEAEEFCEVINIVNSISRISEDYWAEFVLYVTVLFPTAHTKLFIGDFLKIREFLKKINKDLGGVVENKMIQQVLITETGESFYREYLFYSDDKNYINNKDFIQKRDFIIEKHNTFLNKIISTI